MKCQRWPCATCPEQDVAPLLNSDRSQGTICLLVFWSICCSVPRVAVLCCLEVQSANVRGDVAVVLIAITSRNSKQTKKNGICWNSAFCGVSVALRRSVYSASPRGFLMPIQTAGSSRFGRPAKSHKSHVQTISTNEHAVLQISHRCPSSHHASGCIVSFEQLPRLRIRVLDGESPTCAQ